MRIGDKVTITKEACEDNYGIEYVGVVFEIVYFEKNVGGVGPEYTIYDLDFADGSGEFPNALYEYELDRA